MMKIFDIVLVCEFFYDESRTLNKTEVLKLKNKYYTHYYCKNDICVELGYDYLSENVEIPDEKGTIKRYISKSYSYEELKSVWRTVIGLGPDVYFSLNCTSDSQCLTNKCYNNYCVFNEENPIEFCTNIYINLAMFSYDYMYCGKAIGEKCKRNKECGSKRCKKNSCGLPPGGPCDSCVLVGIRNLLYIGIGIITMISIIILLCYCYYFKLNKNLKNNNKKYKKLQNIL